MSVQGAEPAEEKEPIVAVWKERKLSFSYNSSTAIYSCNAMAGRIASILRAVGARDDVQVRVNDCSNTITAPDPAMNGRGAITLEPLPDRMRVQDTGRRQLVTAYVRLMMPIEVTPEVLAELKRDKSRRELVSRATGNPAARFNDPILFSAQRQLVTLSRKTIGIEPEECELLDQMLTSVFRKLDVRVISRDVTCSADSRIPPQLVVETLLPTPYDTGQARQAPAAGKDDAEPAEPAPDKETPE